MKRCPYISDFQRANERIAAEISGICRRPNRKTPDTPKTSKTFCFSLTNPTKKQHLSVVISSHSVTPPQKKSSLKSEKKLYFLLF
jgi:hypothetical protein